MADFPALEDVRLSHAMLRDADVNVVDDDAFRALMALVSQCAARLVWTYSPPSDGSLPDDDDRLARIARVSKRRWRAIRPQLAQFFIIRNGKWHLDRPWISVDGVGRLAIPLAIQRDILAREGQRCAYCGADDGPFHFEHIYPVAKGGTNDAANLVLACAPCNLSKGDKTLAEWIAAGGPPRMRAV